MQDFSQVTVRLFTMRLRRIQVGVWRVFAPAGAKTLHTPTKKARLRARPGEKDPLRNPG